MKRLVITLITTCLYACLSSVQAQDIHFSQFYASPLTLNPSLTGIHSGDFRIVDNYRNQWFTLTVPFVSNSLSFDFPIHGRRLQYAGGINAIYDASGDAKLQVSKFYASFAMLFKPKGHLISIGVQPGYVMKNFDASLATFPDQYNKESGLYDPSLPTSGNYSGNNISYPDLNVGLFWSKKFGFFTPEIGISVFHLNQPTESFLSASNVLDHRKVAHAGFHFITGKKWKITPRILYMEQGKASQMLFGSNFQMYSSKKSKTEFVYFGGFLRSGYSRNIDAGILTIGAGFRELALGLNYDVNVSSLSSASKYQGAFEISLIFTKLNELSNKIAIPCERF